MRVINLNGTSDNVCRCGSWLNHWKNFSGQSLPNRCSVMNCNNNLEVGAHVQKDGSYDKNWYIVPICQDCNAKTYSSLEISDYITLVSANKSETCDKARNY
jgi:hypothetical protein